MQALRLMTDAAHSSPGSSCITAARTRRTGERGCPRWGRASSPATWSPTWCPRRWSSPTSGEVQRVGRGRPRARLRLRHRLMCSAHAYLPMQFLSSFYNKRTDGYGGDLAGRARFWLEILEDVREAVGDDCAIATRIAVDSLGVAGIHVEEALGFVNLADDLVDLWDVNVGSIAEWSKDSGTSRYFEEGYQPARVDRGVRQATTKPIVGVGRLTSPDRMASIVRSGAWDLIGAARPSIADPFLPRKIEEGRTDDITRVHGRQRLHHEGRRLRPPRLHPERDRGRGTRGWHPERFEVATNADRGVRRRGGPGRAGVRGDARAPWLRRRPPRRRQSPRSAAGCVGSGGSRRSATGDGSSTTGRSCSRKLPERRGDRRPPYVCGRRPRLRGPARDRRDRLALERRRRASPRRASRSGACPTSSPATPSR